MDPFVYKAVSAVADAEGVNYCAIALSFNHEYITNRKVFFK